MIIGKLRNVIPLSITLFSYLRWDIKGPHDTYIEFFFWCSNSAFIPKESLNRDTCYLRNKNIKEGTIDQKVQGWLLDFERLIKQILFTSFEITLRKAWRSPLQDRSSFVQYQGKFFSKAISNFKRDVLGTITFMTLRILSKFTYKRCNFYVDFMAIKKHFVSFSLILTRPGSSGL